MADIPRIALKDFIRDIPDFPKEGILFRDITPLLLSVDALRETVRQTADYWRDKKIDVIVGAEARGFLFGTPLALELNVGFVPIRKPGKLPFETRRFDYDLEYGTDSLEMHADAIAPGQNVLVVDDLLATGGTIDACCKLVEEMGGKVAGCSFVVELFGIGGQEKMAGRETFSLIQYQEA